MHNRSAFEEELQNQLSLIRKDLKVLGRMEHDKKQSVNLKAPTWKDQARAIWNLLYKLEDARSKLDRNFFVKYNAIKNASKAAFDLSKIFKVGKIPEVLNQAEQEARDRVESQYMSLLTFFQKYRVNLLSELIHPVFEAVPLSNILQAVSLFTSEEDQKFIPSKDQIQFLLENHRVPLLNKKHGELFINLDDCFDILKGEPIQKYMIAERFNNIKDSTIGREDTMSTSSEVDGRPDEELVFDFDVADFDDELYFDASDQSQRNNLSRESQFVESTASEFEEKSSDSSDSEYEFSSESEEMTWEVFVALTAKLKQQMQAVIDGDAQLTEDLQDKIAAATDQLKVFRTSLDSEQAESLRKLQNLNIAMTNIEQQITDKKHAMSILQANINVKKVKIKEHADSLNDAGYEFEKLFENKFFKKIKANEVIIDGLQNDMLALKVDLKGFRGELYRLESDHQAIQDQMDEREAFIEDAFDEFLVLKEKNEKIQQGIELQQQYRAQKEAFDYLKKQLQPLAQASAVRFPNVGHNAFAQQSIEMLEDYLKQRNEQYRVRDFFDDILTKILGCFGDFKTEKAKREQKVVEIKRSIEHYATSGSKDGFFKAVNFTSDEFKARAPAGSEGYEQSLRGVVGQIKNKLN